MDNDKLIKNRTKVMEAFNNKGEFFHVRHCKTGGYTHTNMIDNPAWLGFLCGAAYLYKDYELASKCSNWLYKCLSFGKDTRNFGTVKCTYNWEWDEEQSLYYTTKEWYSDHKQGLQFAINCGAILENPHSDTMRNAALIRLISPLFAYIYKYRWFRESSLTRRFKPNSIFGAYLLVNKYPPKCLEYLCEENPFFSAISGKLCNIEYPIPRRFIDGDEVPTEKIMPLACTEPCAWLFRRDPYRKYITKLGVYGDFEYTPVSEVTGEYLQRALVLGKSINGLL